MADSPQAPRLFLDSSVLFAASNSASGASRALILLGEIGLVQLVVSAQVFEEVQRNLQTKAPLAVAPFEKFRGTLQWDVREYPSPAQVLEAAQYIAQKDAPILAAAMNANVKRLITLDVRHFKTEAVLSYSKLLIQTPGELLADIRTILSSGLQPGETPSG